MWMLTTQCGLRWCGRCLDGNAALAKHSAEEGDITVMFSVPKFSFSLRLVPYMARINFFACCCGCGAEKDGSFRLTRDCMAFTVTVGEAGGVIFASGFGTNAARGFGTRVATNGCCCCCCCGGLLTALGNWLWGTVGLGSTAVALGDAEAATVAWRLATRVFIVMRSSKDVSKSPMVLSSLTSDSTLRASSAMAFGTEQRRDSKDGSKSPSTLVRSLMLWLPPMNHEPSRFILHAMVLALALLLLLGDAEGAAF
mmetsp:Transcript_5828/g.17381  ORF Transcript_5828/g.17381 Transcript_5828/m.17381 type:complete len:254 (+) Transcript_5828:1618-2379(+)